MLQFTENNFHRTRDQKQLFYQMNFKRNEHNSSEPVLVFNYGLVCSSLHWKYQFEYFHHAGFKILTHDYRGHFRSTGIEDLENITFANIAQDLKEILDENNIQNPILLGHSMGVNIVLEFERMFPGLSKGNVLISGTTLPVKDVMFDTNLMEYIIPIGVSILKKFPVYVKKIWKTSGWNPFIVELIRRGGFNSQQVTHEFVEIYMNRVGELGIDLFLQLFHQMAKHDILGFVSQIQVPTLIMGGDKDGVIPNYLQRMLKNQIPHSEFYLVKNGSHVVQVDFPDFVNERISLFLEKNFPKKLLFPNAQVRA